MQVALVFTVKCANSHQATHQRGKVLPNVLTDVDTNFSS